jgi:hypothetical protein
MLDAVELAFGRWAGRSRDRLRGLRSTLTAVRGALQERVLVFNAIPPACERICRPLDGLEIRVVNGRPDHELPPLHPRCDCQVNLP